MLAQEDLGPCEGALGPRGVHGGGAHWHGAAASDPRARGARGAPHGASGGNLIVNGGR